MTTSQTRVETSKASRRTAEELANAGAIQQASVSGVARVIDAAIAQAVAELKEENTRLLNDADYAADARVAQAVEREQTRIETWLRQQGGSGPFFADALVALRAPAKEVP